MASCGKPAEINLEELERLCAMQATDPEIASWFNVNVRTIERKRKDPIFAEAMERGKQKGRLSVRRAQLRMLEQGNATMAIWLGKQYLGQTDEVRHEVTFASPLCIVLPRGEAGSTISGTDAARKLIEGGEDQESIDVEPVD